MIDPEQQQQQLPIQNEGNSASMSMADVDLFALGRRQPGPEDDATVASTVPDDEVQGTLNKGFRRCGILTCCFPLLVCVAVLVVVSVAVAVVFANPSDGNQRKTNTYEVVRYLIDEGLGSSTDFEESTDSPRYKAALWLAETDPKNLALPRRGVTQGSLLDRERNTYIARYIMTVMYFSLGGRKSEALSSFLAESDTCRWNKRMLVITRTGPQLYPVGVFCEEGDITKIQLCECECGDMVFKMKVLLISLLQLADSWTSYCFILSLFCVSSACL